MNNLTKSITIAGHKIKNRICMPPLVCFQFGNGMDGFVIQKNVEHYRKRAKAGTGLIVVEATCISPECKLSSTQLGIWKDEHIKGLAEIADVCHEFEAVVTVQIHHGGFNVHAECGDAVSSSPWEFKGRIARKLSIKEIEKIHKDFVSAAIRTQKAGFDGVQLHGCHSYLLNAFASDLVNKRSDKYGGNAKNRTRLACSIIKDIRANCGKNFIIDIRMAGNDPTPEIGVENAKYYIDAGVDMLSVSGGIGNLESVVPPIDFPFEKITWLGVNIKNKYPNIPVAAVCGITTKEQAEQLAGLVDFVSVGRAMLADGDWSSYALNNTPLASPCLKCKRCLWFSNPDKCPALKNK